jgi:hypothetical protein
VSNKTFEVALDAVNWTEVADLSTVPGQLFNLQVLNPTAEKVQWSFSSTGSPIDGTLPDGMTSITQTHKEIRGKIYAKAGSGTPTLTINVW